MIAAQFIKLSNKVFNILTIFTLVMSMFSGGGVRTVRAEDLVISEGTATTVTMSTNGSPTPFDLTLHATGGVAALTWSISSDATNGTASLTDPATGNSVIVGYTPNHDYVGTDTFGVQVTDSTSTATITVNVTINTASVDTETPTPNNTPTLASTAEPTSTPTNTPTPTSTAEPTSTPTNTPPVITEGGSTSVTMSKNSSPTAFTLTLHATGADAGQLVWSISSPAAHGTATASGTGISKSIGYIPDTDYSGPDSFVVQVDDGIGGVDNIRVNIAIVPPHDRFPIVADHWISNGPENGTIRAIAIDPVNTTTVYAATVYGGVFKSTDGGGNWTTINNGLPTTWYIFALAIDPETPTTIYAGTGNGKVYKSTNGGGNWTALSLAFGNSISSLAIDPATSTTLYAGTDGGGVYKSIDGGMNWNGVNSGLTNTHVWSLAIDPETDTTLYAGTDGGGAFKSTDGGGNWQEVNTGLTSTHVEALLIDPTTPSTIYAGTVYKY